MLKTYLKIAWRNIQKNKIFTSINVLGLTVAFAVAILLSINALFELSFDKEQENLDEIYSVYQKTQTPKGARIGTSMPEPLKNTLKEQIPAIKNAARYLESHTIVSYQGKDFSLDTEWTDAEYFDIFSFKVIEGNTKSALELKDGLVLTQKTANKIFGSENALGKTVHILLKGKPTPFVVKAIIENLPLNSSFNFDLLGSFEAHPSFEENKNEWDSQYHSLYVRASKNIHSLEIKKISQEIYKKVYPNSIEQLIEEGAQPDENGLYFYYNFLPFKDYHFASFPKDQVKVSRFYPYLLLGISMLIIFIACVNFMNMSIAGIGQRLKEIGLRKTLGAYKNLLFFQFWSESLMIFLISLGLGGLLSYLLLGKFQELFRTNASFDQLANPLILISGFILVLLVSFISGGYPALMMSKIGTIQALKGKLSVKKGALLRNVLITAQFGIAIMLITGTIVLWSQVQFMKNKDLGYDKEQVISFQLNGKKDSYKAMELLRNELANNPNILNISASDNNLGRGKDGSMYRSVLGFNYNGKSVSTNLLIVDNDYVETLGLELKEGRSFDRKFKSEKAGVVINEAMAKELEEENPVGKIIDIEFGKVEIIGVVKDYHFQKLNTSIEPISLFMTKEWGVLYAFVKIAPTNMQASFRKIEEAWKKIEPNATFLGSFIDENLDRTYKSEQRTITMVSIASIIAIVLSSIGLFAMSLLVVNQRTKEIGVRKVIGASISSIAFLLTKDFLKLVGIAFVVVSPITWFLLKDWLQDYAYRIDLSAWFFLLAGVLAMFIAILTIGTKSISAAMQNPTKSLKTE